MPRFLIFTNSKIDSGMANVNQTLKMASALAKNFEVDVFIRGTELVRCRKLVATVIGGRVDFNLFVSNRSAAHNVLRLFWKLPKISPRPFLYTRSLVVGAISAFFCQKVLVELHQDRFTSFSLLAAFLARLLTLPYFKERVEIIVISDALKQMFQLKYRAAERFHVLHDAADPQPPSMLTLHKRQRQLVVYTGKVDEERSLSKIISLAKVFEQLDFRILGGGPEITKSVRRSVALEGLGNIKIFRRQGAKRVSYYQCKADILLGFWSNQVPTMNYCSPLKVFEYLHTGNKILLQKFPVLDEVVPRHNHIEYCDPEDFSSHVAALDCLLKKATTQRSRSELIELASEFTYAKRASALAAIAFNE